MIASTYSLILFTASANQPRVFRAPAVQEITGVLTLRGVTKFYGGVRGRQVLRDISLTIAPGELVAIMGESGAGKSTLLNLIAGLDVADAGSITFDGVELNKLDDTARTLLRRARMGFVFQAFHLLPHLTVMQNVRLPLDLAAVARTAADARTRAMLDAVGIAALAHDYPRTLSGGEAQRAAIARALVHAPALVLADEPTGNLDHASATQVLTLLREQISERAGAGVLVTHSHTAARIADRIYVLTQDGLSTGEA
jgi:putative ABC transport system ATP-binding protein